MRKDKYSIETEKSVYIGKRYKGYVFSKVYEIINLKTGACDNHAYSIKECKLKVDKSLKEKK